MLLFDYKPLLNLPFDIQRDWLAELHSATPTEQGTFRLIGIRRTKPKSFEEQRLIVLAVDENGLPLPGVMVAFAYSTAHPYLVDEKFLWQPPSPRRADIFPTRGSGEIEHIQGSVVQAGEPGGVTVCILEPEYSSDVVTGAGMLADHTGLYLVFQLRRTGVEPIVERLARLEAEVAVLKTAHP
ncbi:MAG: hypothetical protein KJ077_19715 [Anaerolineae bacterium]|nr:hypothetical protein [Anaerolineae bacterium]GIK41594.1 MAG: hypothetical protein BroJett011_54270 [Chloroflexota bacterium]